MSDSHIYSVVAFDQDTPVMDREQIEMLLLIDDEEESMALIGELFNLFDSESRAKLAELERVCMANAVVDLRKIVHFIAGSAGNLGLARLAAFYRAIEHSIDSGALGDISSAAAPIRAEFEAGSAAFKAEFGI
ncbi:MAG TPA: hypothetical protein DCX06_04875 [Opitutae bacterium]|nr:hypothetical protein [Opitutae bacterium]